MAQKGASGAPKCRGEPAKMGQKGVNMPLQCVLGPFETIWTPFQCISSRNWKSEKFRDFDNFGSFLTPAKTPFGPTLGPLDCHCTFLGFKNVDSGLRHSSGYQRFSSVHSRIIRWQPHPAYLFAYPRWQPYPAQSNCNHKKISYFPIISNYFPIIKNAEINNVKAHVINYC